MAKINILVTVKIRWWAKPLIFLCILFRIHKINWLWHKILKLTYKVTTE